MKELLILAGYSTFQASCLAPWLWFLLIGAVLCGIAESPKHLWKEA